MAVSQGAHNDSLNQEWRPFMHHVNCTMIWNPLFYVVGFSLTSFINWCANFSVASWESTRWWGGACPALKCATPRSTRWESLPQTRPPPSPDSGTSWVSCASWRRRPARSSAAAGSVVCINYYVCVSCCIVSGCYWYHACFLQTCLPLRFRHNSYGFRPQIPLLRWLGQKLQSLSDFPFPTF